MSLKVWGKCGGKSIFPIEIDKGIQTVVAETPVFTGTDGETRTLKGIHPGDFESPASTNSATSARFLTIYINFAFTIIRENRVAVKCRVL